MMIDEVTARHLATIDALEKLVDLMRKKLDANMHKYDWRKEGVAPLFGLLGDKKAELCDSILASDSAQSVWDEAADVANLAMMIAANYEQKCVEGQ